MTDKGSGWDDFFEPEQELEPSLPGDSKPRPGGELASYLQLPGVIGAIQVTLDGVVLHQAVPNEIEYYSALTAATGATARQVGQMLSLGGSEYSVVRMAADKQSVLVVRVNETFVGLLLSGEIAPTHIIARLQDLRSGRLG